MNALTASTSCHGRSHALSDFLGTCFDINIRWVRHATPLVASKSMLLINGANR